MVKPSTMRLVQLLLGANGALGALTQDNFIESQGSWHLSFYSTRRAFLTMTTFT